ncbi:hypothetical protein WA158_007692 [Blastocystis sp. Blastoise]
MNCSIHPHNYTFETNQIPLDKAGFFANDNSRLKYFNKLNVYNREITHGSNSPRSPKTPTPSEPIEIEQRDPSPASRNRKSSTISYSLLDDSYVHNCDVCGRIDHIDSSSSQDFIPPHVMAQLEDDDECGSLRCY